MLYDMLIKSQYYVPATLKPAVIIDIGSNIGGSVLHFHQRFPSAHIYGFEPHPDTYRILESNVAHLSSVSVFNFGLSNLDRKLQIPFRGPNFSVFSTAQPAKSDSDAHLVNCEIRNIAATLAGLGIEKVDLIKFDCEGAEHGLLEALPESVLENCQWIVGEIHNEKGFELLAFLTKYFDLDLRKRMFSQKFLFHACNKKTVSQLKGTFRRSRLQP
jgi:FkbM family methyltransferase